jgi:hypothetical protein
VMPFANLCNSRNTNHRGSLAVNARSTDFESTNAANYALPPCKSHFPLSLSA